MQHTQHIKVWDLPTRLFHWLLALMVVALFITGSMGGNLIERHMQLGYAVLVLLLFRVIWGVMGGYWSRFASFFPTPSRLTAYLKGETHLPQTHIGHNPLGAFSVFALLLILLVQVGTGLISDDEIAFTGPLVHWVSSATTTLATNYHKNYGKFIIISLVFAHVVAIVFYALIKEKNLIPAMLHGYQDAPASASWPSSADHLRARVLAVVVLMACVGVVWWLVTQTA
jgi:cytochrome b